MTAQFGDRKKLTSRIVWTLLALFVLGGGAFLLWKPLLALTYFAATGGNASMTEAVDNRPLGYFYRFSANYSHNGESLNFDYVVACNIRVTSYRDGGTSNDSTYTPKVMMMPTSDGGAIMVRTIRACKGETTANGDVPEDLFPMAIWFDDINDMTFGWGYATEDAYESELSQLEFHGAKIEVSNRERWEAWREASAEGFQAVGMITTPWGLTYNEPWYGRSNKKPYDHTQRNVPFSCDGYYRQEIPETVQKSIKAFVPLTSTRYWSPRNKDEQQILEILARAEYGDGRDKEFITGFSASSSLGLPTRIGSGTLQSWRKLFPSEVYPMLPLSRSTSPVIKEPAESYPRRLLYKNGEMRGFLACGGDAPGDKTLRHLDPNYRDKRHPVFIDDNLVLDDQKSPLTPGLIFDRVQFVFTKGPPGWGNP